MAEPKCGWKRVKLGEVATNSTVATKDWAKDGFERYIIGKHIPEDGSPIRTSNPVGDAEFGSRIRTIFRVGDIICTTRGPKLKIAVPEFDGLSAHTNFILRTKNEQLLLQGLLEAVVRSDGFQDHLRKHFRGSTNLFVNWSDAAQYEFALPPPEMQGRIVALLSAKVGADAALERAVSECDRLPDVVLSDFLVSLFGTDRPQRFEARRAPKGVHLRKAGDVLRARQGLQISQRDRFKAPGPSLHPYITTQYLLHGGDVEHVPASSSRVLCVENDVLVVRTGMTNGQVFTGLRGVFHNNFFAVDYDPKVLDRDFLVAYLRHPHVRSLMQSLSGATNIPDLNHGDFYSMPLPVPPIAQQVQLVARYAQAHAAATALKSRLAESRSLTRTALRHTLEGA